MFRFLVIGLLCFLLVGCTNNEESGTVPNAKSKDSSVSTKATASNGIQETPINFKVEKMESRIATIEADEKKLKAIEYRYFLESTTYISPENYKDIQFDVINTPLRNPYTIQQIKPSRKEPEGYIYELLISTMYSSAYSDEKLRELENTPGFQLVLVQGDNQSFIY